jgi:hypothetical protein
VIFDQNTQLDTGNNLQVDLKRTPHARTGPDRVNRTMRRRRKREEWVKVKRVHYPGGKQEKGKEGKEKGKQGEREEEWGREAEQQSQEGVERRPWPRMRELVKELMIGRVGLKGKSAAKDTFTNLNCLTGSYGDFVDGLRIQ